MSISLELDATITFPAPTADTDPAADAARALAKSGRLNASSSDAIDAIAAMFADSLADEFGGDVEISVAPTGHGGHIISLAGAVPGDLLDVAVFELLATTGITSTVSTVDENGEIDTDTYGPQL